MARLEQADIELIINGVAERLQTMLDLRDDFVDAIKAKSAGNSAVLPNDIMDTNEVAAHLGVSRRFISQAIKERKLPFFKVGRQIRFRRSEIDSQVSRSVIKSQRLCSPRKELVGNEPNHAWVEAYEKMTSGGGIDLESGRRKLEEANRKPIVQSISDEPISYKMLLRNAAMLRISRRHIKRH